MEYEHYKYCDNYRSKCIDCLGICELNTKVCLIDTGDRCDIWEEHKAELEAEDAPKLGGD